MPVEENLMQAILLTFGTAMVPVLEAPGRHSCGSGGGTLPGCGLPGVHPGQYGAGALYPAADPPDLRLAPGTPLFGPRIDWLERRAHLKGRMVRKYRLPGLIILVAIPCRGPGPGRGLWWRPCWTSGCATRCPPSSWAW